MRKVNAGVKAALEFGPLLVFLGAIFLFKGHEVEAFGQTYGATVMATVLFVPLMLAATLALRVLTGKLSPMQVITLILVLVMGGLTIWLNDPRFFKMKPTILYLMFAAILGFGLWRGHSYLALVMEEAMPLQQEGWMALTRRMMVLFIALALANEIVWRHTSDQLWALYKFPGMFLVMLGFFVSQAGLLKRYALEGDKDA